MENIVNLSVMTKWQMSWHWQIFGRKKEKKEDIREEESVQTEVSETEDAIEELENENQSQVETAAEVSL